VTNNNDQKCPNCSAVGNYQVTYYVMKVKTVVNGKSRTIALPDDDTGVSWWKCLKCNYADNNYGYVDNESRPQL